MASLLAGCGNEKDNENKKAILEGMALEKSMIMMVDGETLIARPCEKDEVKINCLTSCPQSHYKDVITGSIYHVIPYTTSEVNKDIEKGKFSSLEAVRRNNSCLADSNITAFEDEIALTTLSNKLTVEELKKANDGKFTDADLIELHQRLAKESKTLG